MIVRLLVVNFVTEWSPNCTHDWVGIYDSAGTLMGGTGNCGQGRRGAVIHLPKSMRIEFHTNHAVTESGFIFVLSAIESQGEDSSSGSDESDLTSVLNEQADFDWYFIWWNKMTDFMLDIIDSIRNEYNQSMIESYSNN